MSAAAEIAHFVIVRRAAQSRVVWELWFKGGLLLTFATRRAAMKYAQKISGPCVAAFTLRDS